MNNANEIISKIKQAVLAEIFRRCEYCDRKTTDYLISASERRIDRKYSIDKYSGKLIVRI